MLGTLQQNLPALPHECLYSWLYLRNPEGQALGWIATDPPNKGIVGVAGAFPRRIYCSGREVRGYVLGDFCIDRSYRSLGLALALQRACLEGLSTSGAGFVFDFPSPVMMAVYKRLRISSDRTLVRHARLFRVDRKVAERIPVRALARGLSTVANAGLRLRDRNARRAGKWKIAIESSPCGEEFTHAGREWSPKLGICVARTAEYLNWRYREHPQQRYEIMSARAGGKLKGYLVFHMEGQDCVIDDLVGENDTVDGALLTEASATARERGVYTLSAPWLSSHRGGRLLEKCGFRPRESRPVVVITLPAMAALAPQAQNDWYLSRGDCES